jgi:hypothetical protein
MSSVPTDLILPPKWPYGGGGGVEKKAHWSHQSVPGRPAFWTIHLLLRSWEEEIVSYFPLWLAMTITVK